MPPFKRICKTILYHRIVHLRFQKDDINLLGQKRENRPIWGASGATSCESSDELLPSEPPCPSSSSLLSLIFWSLSSSSAVTSAISPGLLSKRPLNCFRAFFSASYTWIGFRISLNLYVFNHSYVYKSITSQHTFSFCFSLRRAAVASGSADLSTFII